MSDYLLWQGAEAAAFRYPDRIAVSEGPRKLRHAELADLSARVGGLLTSMGARRGERIGLLAPKSVRTVAVMLGALRAGLPYVPVDPLQPLSRSSFIIHNAGVRVLLTSRRILRALAADKASTPDLRTVVLVDDDRGDGFGLPGVEVIPWSAVVAQPPNAPATALEDDPAYMLYTSGSTGTPKGVVVSHRNALTFVQWALRTFGVAPQDRLSNHAPLHFDLSVFDIYAALHAGASVHLVPDRVHPFPVELARWIESEGITVWYSVPSALIRLLKQGRLDRYRYKRLRAVLFAGEVFAIKHLRQAMEAFAHSRFYNLYGPTETNVCTYYEVPRPLPEALTDLPIGDSCSNIECLAITPDGRRAEPGEEAELVVRGPCVMLGYWGLPERTAAAVVQNPLHQAFTDVVYKTGDVVAVRPEGGFLFVGRRDHMVKTRGYRVELGEIEYQLHECPGVTDAAVVAIPDDQVGARLLAAIVPERPGLTAHEIERHCAGRLPNYAVPEQFTFVAELPRTSTGKVDRQRLAERLASNQHQGTS